MLMLGTGFASIEETIFQEINNAVIIDLHATTSSCELNIIKSYFLLEKYSFNQFLTTLTEEFHKLKIESSLFKSKYILKGFNSFNVNNVKNFLIIDS